MSPKFINVTNSVKQLNTMPSGFIELNWNSGEKSCPRHKIKSKQKERLENVEGKRQQEHLSRESVEATCQQSFSHNNMGSDLSCAVVQRVLLHVLHQVKRCQSGYVLVFCLLIRFPWKHGGMEKCYQPPERNGMHLTCTRPVGSLFADIKQNGRLSVSPVLCVVAVSI